ncbi:MAG: (Fe-S)-binding protein [Pseudomarimonas sp.]
MSNVELPRRDEARPDHSRPDDGPHDEISRRLLRQTQACVRCGLCQPHCPTYTISQTETESPRGRISLAAALAQDRLGDAFVDAADALDHCLSCRRCESVCPAGVTFDALMADARAMVRAKRAPNWRQRGLEWAISKRWLLALGWPLLRLARALLPLRWIPYVPPIPAAPPRAGVHSAQGISRGRLALFTGCVAQRLDADVHRAAITVLTRLGWDVWLPSGPLCCGALHRHAGALVGAAEQAESTRQTMLTEVAGCAAVLIAVSGCYADLHAALAGTGVPVHELLAFVADDQALPTLPLRTSSEGVIVHTPCTQATAVGQSDAAAKVLATIPGLRIHSLADRGCCGAAGSNALTDPQRANVLRATLLDSISNHTATTLCSANVGCRIHLASGLNERHSTLRTQHPIQRLAEHLL